MKPHRQKIFICSVVLSIVISGCATFGSIPDAQPLPDNHGILVVRVRNVLGLKFQLQFVPYKDRTTRSDRVNEYFAGPTEALLVKSGTYDYWVIQAPAGDYMWGKIIAFSYPANFEADMHDGNWFRIEPGKVNYVGHVTVVADDENLWNASRIGIVVENNAKESMSYMRRFYPEYSKRFQFVNNVTQFRN